MCRKTFSFLHTIGKKRLQNLAKSLKENGITPCIHGNVRKRPQHSLSFISTEFMVRFLLIYAEQNVMLLPGRVPGYSRSDIKLLPSSVSKRGIWKVYRCAADEKEEVHSVAYTTFCQLWRTLIPSVIIMKPMTDLCWTCHKTSTAILRAANSTETKKSSTIKEAEEHLRIVQVERSFYKTTCDDCRKSVMKHFTVDGEFWPPFHCHHVFPQILMKSRCITPLTMRSRSTFHLIPSNQDLFTSLHLGSVLCSELIVRLCPGKSTF